MFSNLQMVEESKSFRSINVTADQVLYVAPSPQVTLDGLLISFLVQDKSGVTTRHHSSIGGTIARHKRDQNSTENQTTGYLPSTWIVTALRTSQGRLETVV